jgi:hypothetical protein
MAASLDCRVPARLTVPLTPVAVRPPVKVITSAAASPICNVPVWEKVTAGVMVLPEPVKARLKVLLVPSVVRAVDTSKSPEKVTVAPPVLARYRVLALTTPEKVTEPVPLRVRVLATLVSLAVV